MTTTLNKHLIVAARRAMAPEFRAAHKAFGRAYCGPEQRQRVPHRFTGDQWPGSAVNAAPGILLPG